MRVRALHSGRRVPFLKAEQWQTVARLLEEARRWEMRSKLIACALLISVSSTAFADPKDYNFQAVGATVKKGNDRYDSQ